MRRPSSATARPGAVALITPVLLAAFGTSGAASAAVSAAPGHQQPRPAALATVTKVRWHALRLVDGWKSARSKSYAVANPQYAISGGVVYLDGSLHQTSGTKEEFAVLPRAARPARNVILAVLSGSGVGQPGTLEIKPTGAMIASSPAGSTRLLTALQSVSYPAAGARWHRLTLSNGWTSGRRAFGTNDPGYTVRNGGVVYLTGSLRTAGTVAKFGTLPPGTRPARALYITVHDHGVTAGNIVVEPDGILFSYGAAADAQTSLDGVSFPSAGAKLTWHKLKLATGWSSSQSQWNSGDPAYAIAGPIVYLAGSMHFDTLSGGNAIFAEIAKPAQAVNEITRLVDTFGGTTGGITLTPSLGLAASTPGSYAQQFSSLAGISYPRNS